MTENQKTLTTTKEPVGTMTEKPKRKPKRKQSQTVAMESTASTPVSTAEAETTVDGAVTVAMETTASSPMSAAAVLNNPSGGIVSSNDQPVDALPADPNETVLFGSLFANATKAVRKNVAENPFTAVMTDVVVALLGMLLMSINSNTDRLDTRINRVEDKIETRFAEQDAKFEARFAEQDAKFEARFASIDQRFEQLDAKFEGLDTKLDNIDLKLTALIAGLNATLQVEAALDGRLLDPNAPTRPGR